MNEWWMFGSWQGGCDARTLGLFMPAAKYGRGAGVGVDGYVL